MPNQLSRINWHSFSNISSSITCNRKKSTANSTLYRDSHFLESLIVERNSNFIIDTTTCRQLSTLTIQFWLRRKKCAREKIAKKRSAKKNFSINSLNVRTVTIRLLRQIRQDVTRENQVNVKLAQPTPLLALLIVSILNLRTNKRIVTL